MPVLVSPPSYITSDDFLNMPLDYDLSAYNDDQISDLLVRASGIADAYLRKTLLATERVERFRGSGNSKLALHNRPILYIKQMQFVVPGLVGQTIPLDRVNIDYERGEIEVLRAMALESIGYEAFFPERVPIDITYAWGYGFNPYAPPAWSAIDTNYGAIALSAGAYAIGVTTRTQWGETLANIQTVTTQSGAIKLTVQPALGAYSYRVYAASAANGVPAASAMTLVGEVPSATFTDGPSGITISSLAAPPYTFAQTLSASDTSAPPLPSELREAIRLLTMQILYEQNNLSNRGVARTESGRKSVQWRSTEGSGGRGIPLYAEQAQALLSGLSLQEIY